MQRIWHQLSGRRICLLLTGVVLTSDALAAYLPRLGPSPIRFQTVRPMLATVAVLPPLNMGWEEAAAATNAVVTVKEPDPATKPPEKPAEVATVLPAEELPPGYFVTLPTSSNAPPVATTAPEPATSPAEPPPPIVGENTATVTPQMLLHFFRPTADGTNTTLITIPAGAFLPPQPRTALPSSTATYNVK